jgi:hypothetical protein
LTVECVLQYHVANYGSIFFGYNLGGHLKTGQAWTSEKRPRGDALTLVYRPGSSVKLWQKPFWIEEKPCAMLVFLQPAVL